MWRAKFNKFSLCALTNIEISAFCILSWKEISKAQMCERKILICDDFLLNKRTTACLVCLNKRLFLCLFCIFRSATTGNITFVSCSDSEIVALCATVIRTYCCYGVIIYSNTKLYVVK